MDLREQAKGYYRAYERHDRYFMEENLAAAIRKRLLNRQVLRIRFRTSRRVAGHRWSSSQASSFRV